MKTGNNCLQTVYNSMCLSNYKLNELILINIIDNRLPKTSTILLVNEITQKEEQVRANFW